MKGSIELNEDSLSSLYVNQLQIHTHTEQMFCQKSNKPGCSEVKQLPAEIKLDNEENEAL